MKHFILGIMVIMTALLASCAGVSPIVNVTQSLDYFPLAEKGPYFVGRVKIDRVDAARGEKPVSIMVWYPAYKPSKDFKGNVTENGTADMAGAPYPLIISSSKVAGFFAPYLVTHGFTWVSVNGIDTYPYMEHQMIDQPLDILFALESVASDPPAGLEGVIDAERTGAIGYSFDGYNTLAMSGVRIDPGYYLSQCPTPDDQTASILSGLSAFSCSLAEDWDDFVEYAGENITTSEDGLWQPLTDERIRAVMPLAGEGWWAFGPLGLEAVHVPILTIVSENDELYAENALIFEHLGSQEKTFITFMGKDHMMIYENEMVARIAHFAVAFFGAHLQGWDDYRQYYSKEYVSSVSDMHWGVIER